VGIGFSHLSKIPTGSQTEIIDEIIKRGRVGLDTIFEWERRLGRCRTPASNWTGKQSPNVKKYRLMEDQHILKKQNIHLSLRDPSTIYHPLKRWSIRFCCSENFPVSSPVQIWRTLLCDSNAMFVWYNSGLFFWTEEIKTFTTKKWTVMPGNNRKWKAQKQRAWFDSPDQLLSDLLCGNRSYTIVKSSNVSNGWEGVISHFWKIGKR